MTFSRWADPFWVCIGAFALFVAGLAVPSALYEAVLASIAITILAAFSISCLVAALAYGSRWECWASLFSVVVLGLVAGIIHHHTWALLTSGA